MDARLSFQMILKKNMEIIWVAFASRLKNTVGP